ncbi:RNA polymerase sigma factor [Pseudoclavibacter sp. CFCC 11306]|uniref:RNA polymerase sigma factor n=1 Tax=Pseudoclavibacter sp. CFCC 11306 TaxID=1564493 RepID=UPI00130193BC|nr:sigma-70 family RNA polymerase sigma factor [Pseudoclavibacter sp. CFCC 11306]KAB1658592.1 sigma-70 family RNA polymerase sigma factor [Pseudoclavibacter sp. CFCC 11306]
MNTTTDQAAASEAHSSPNSIDQSTLGDSDQNSPAPSENSSLANNDQSKCGCDHSSTAGSTHEQYDALRFEPLVASLLPDLVRYFAMRVQPNHEAPDCAAETLLVMWQKIDRLPATTDGQRAWAFGIARKVAANHHRKRRRRTEASESLRQMLQAQLKEVVGVQLTRQQGRAINALRMLPADDQELLRLVVWDGFGVAEAGGILGLRPDAARKRYQRARARFREAYATA